MAGRRKTPQGRHPQDRSGNYDYRAYGYGHAPGAGFFPGYFGMWPGFGFGGYGYTYPQEHVADMSDADIRDRILDALDENPIIPETADIRVDVQDRIVALSGSVRSKNTKRAAGEAAWSIPAVSDVNNNINVAGRRRQAQQQSEP